MPQQPIEHDRRRFIGGSDVPAVLGLSPWRTPLALYEQKIADEPEQQLTPEREKFFRRRKRQEPVVAEMLAEEYGIEVTRLSLDADPNRYVDRAPFEYLAAEIDFECVMTERVRAAFRQHAAFAEIQNGVPLNGEIKTVNAFRAREWQDDEGNADLPIHYAAQAMHGLGVTERAATIVAALIGIDTLIAFPVMHDAETIASMREKCALFWAHVRSRVPPEPSNLDEIKALYKQFRGTRVELDDETYALFEQRFAKHAEAKKATDSVESIDHQIAEYMMRAWGTPAETHAYDGPEYERAVLVYKGHQVGSWNRQRGAHLNQQALRKSYPDIVKAYTEDHYYRVMRRKARP